MERTITLSEQTYQALQREATRSQKAVDVLVEEWLTEYLYRESGPVAYHEITGKSEVLRETRAVDQRTITLELPSEVYDGLRELAAEDRIDPIQVLAGLVKRAQLLQIRNVSATEEPVPTGSDLFRRLADLAQDLGVEDLAEQHDHYLYGTEKQ